MRYAALALLAVAVLFEAAGDILFKQSATTNKYVYFYVGFAVYVVGSLLWAYSLRFNLLSRSIVIFMVLNVIVVVAAGILFFKEHVTLATWIGMLLGVLSVILLEF
jgi:multidrug transporter EmrE-like cation transporter